MQTEYDLKDLLERIDHRGYPSYKQTAGKWEFRGFTLSIDHVQGDPFASPSNVSVIVDGKRAGFPAEYYNKRHRRIALEDHLLRLFSRELSSQQGDRGGREEPVRADNPGLRGGYTRESDRGDRESYGDGGRGGRGGGRSSGSGKSGLLATSRPGQEILERTAMHVDPKTGSVVARFEVGFPAHGRTVFIAPLVRIFYSILPKVVQRCLYYKNVDQGRLEQTIFLADDALALRQELKERRLVAFVANGSVLARESGVSQRPMKGAVPFVSPESLAITITLPHHGDITGMGIHEGVFLIVGGGYHGKSTLLLALERGVYDHVAGDGREFVITRSDAMKIRAEDGRSVRSADVSLFINDLPNKADTKAFSTDDASGSTSQAAAVVEAMESKTSLLLVDEDTCATNFMVRDDLMRRVVASNKEPITPFLSRMRELYDEAGISTVMVAGSSGSFFEVADAIIQMDEYVPKDVTEMAKSVYEAHVSGEEELEPASPFKWPDDKRLMQPVNEWKKPNARVKTKVLAVDGFSIDRENVDLRGLSQVVDREQTAAIAAALKYAGKHIANGRRSVREVVDFLYGEMADKGLVALFDGQTVRLGLAMPRKEEVLGAINRWRKLRVRR